VSQDEHIHLKEGDKRVTSWDLVSVCVVGGWWLKTVQFITTSGS
jgi:hypothetical protein